MFILGENKYLIKLGKLKNEPYIGLSLYHNFKHKTKDDDLSDDDFKACILTFKLTPLFAFKLGEALIKTWFNSGNNVKE